MPHVPKTLLIVGTSFHTLPAYLRAHGFEYIILKDARLVRDARKQLRRVVCDFGSRQTTLAAVDRAAARRRIDGVIATYERYVLAAANIAAYLDVPGLPLRAAQACTDKALMRQKLTAAAEPISPPFAVVGGPKDLQRFAARHGFPLMLKPAHLSKSLLVFKCDTPEQLMDDYKRMTATIGAVYKRYAPHMPPKILVEVFMCGSAHSVDAFVDQAGESHVLEQVVDYQTGYEAGYNDNFHYSRLLPSRLPAAQVARIRRVAAMGCRALGIKNSAAHVEIIITDDGPRIVEIGARSGGYRERMHRLANGLDITANVVALSLGQPPRLAAGKNEPLGVFELFPKKPGLFAGISHEAQLRALPSLAYYAVQARAGAFVGNSSDGYKMCAVVMLHNQNAAQFAKDMAFLNAHVSVQTNPVKD